MDKHKYECCKKCKLEPNKECVDAMMKAVALTTHRVSCNNSTAVQGAVTTHTVVSQLHFATASQTI